MQIPVQTKASVYEVGVQELHKVSREENERRHMEAEFNEARGREAARLHVTLRAISEADARSAENTRQTLEAIRTLTADLQERAAALSHLIENFENLTEKRFGNVQDDLRQRAEALGAQIGAFSQSETGHFEATKTQVAEFREALTTLSTEQFTAVTAQAENNFTKVTAQAEQNYNSLTDQNTSNTKRLEQDVQQARDEIVRLVDSRMNQSDASFAALRGDLEVVKFLVMDIIKDRIGRADPKTRSV